MDSRGMFVLVAFRLVACQLALWSVAASAAPPQPVKTVQDVIVTNTAETAVPVIVSSTVGADVLSVPVMNNPYIRNVSCGFPMSGNCEAELLADEPGYIWGIEFSLAIRGDGPCFVTAMVRDSHIASYHYQKAMTESTAEKIGTPETFNRVVLPRVIPYVVSDAFKVHAGSYSTTGTSSYCQATVNFLYNTEY